LKLIEKYFPSLSENQKKQLSELKSIYSFWNSQINVISRKDMDSFYERHVLHSMSIAKIISFKDNAEILDIGTGGGFPGIPLAILYPDVNFVLVDSIGKKIKVVKEVSSQLKIKNVQPLKLRGEEVDGQFDFIISRAVTRLNKFMPWTTNKIKSTNNHSIKNGVLYLKGGDLKQEIDEAKLKFSYSSYSLHKIINEPFFESKVIIHIPFS